MPDGSSLTVARRPLSGSDLFLLGGCAVTILLSGVINYGRLGSVAGFV